MGQPKVGKELDRINNNGDYNFENCRWTDGITQGNNTRRNRYLEYNGRKQTIAQWARELNISPNKIIKRIDYQNWSIERTLNTK